MATKRTAPTTTADDYQQVFPNWVYQTPGFALIIAGFGGLAFLTLF